MALPKYATEVLKFQDRDLAVLCSLFESRIMTSTHVASLHFAGSREAAKKRLGKLKAAGLIGERKRHVSEHSILFLTRKGLTVLRDEGTLTDYPRISMESLVRRSRVSEMTVRHELEVMAVKSAFHEATRSHAEFQIAEFTTWAALAEFKACPFGRGEEITIKPDGFIRIHETENDGGLSEHTYFLELDRSTESQNLLFFRAGCYLDYFKSGAFAERNGASRSEYRDYPFRVLMVFKTAARLYNTAERLLAANPPILKQACLTTFDEVKENPFGQIWIRPFEYRATTNGTRFEAVQKRAMFGYKKQTERDLFIERNVKKISLFFEEQ